MSKTFYKVMFGAFAVCAFVDGVTVINQLVDGDFQMSFLAMFLLIIVICQLCWKLWHRPTVEKKEYVIINFDTGRIIGDSMFDADEFSKELNRYYEHKLMHEMKIVDAVPFINIKED